MHRMRVIEEDITTLSLDAIVNAANESHRAAAVLMALFIAQRDPNYWPSAARSVDA